MGGHEEVLWGHSHQQLQVLTEFRITAFSICNVNPGNNISLNFKAF